MANRQLHSDISDALKLTFPNFAGPTEGLHGLYLQAFCRGLDLVLDTYRELLRGLELEVLQDPNLTVAYVSSGLEEVTVLCVSYRIHFHKVAFWGAKDLFELFLSSIRCCFLLCRWFWIRFNSKG